MASFNSAAARPAAYGAPVPIATPPAPVGTFAPGTKIQVGGHKVVIQKYFSEGGFAHVYLVKMPKPIDGTDIAVLKRVAVPDKDSLANMRTEVETMKKLKGHRPIVTYYDSHASQLKGGGYEVFLLMEFCNGGGLIDFMNTRLQNRLTEPEILKIFSDVTEGVACMHYLKPPLLHRDLKVENVLITSTGSSKRFKLCDFGSTAPPRPAATTAAECRLIEDDVQKHTTLQYRSPEMIDVYRKQPIDEKSDIWALGVLLYKLCYYTTPFEEQGQLAILNASFKYPAYPPFSDKLKKLIASMLKENPRSRPNVYQVLREACLMQGIEVPIRDIYAGRTESESRRNEKLPPLPSAVASPPTMGAVFAPPVQQKQVLPDIAPMRRGRPTTTPQAPTAKPNPSPMRAVNSDPFAALDGKQAASPPNDEIAARFPSLDQFALLHDRGGKFEFDATSPTAASPTAAPKPKDLSQRVTERLADDAFIVPPQNRTAVPPPQKPATGVSKAQQIISSTPALLSAVSPPTGPIYEPKPTKPSMVSTGTMTSDAVPPSDSLARKYTPSPIYRFPPAGDHHRSASVPRNQPVSASAPQFRPDDKLLPNVSSVQKNSSFLQPSHGRHASSSRPSLESGRPSSEAIEQITRTRSSNSQQRPSSTYVESSVDYLREREATSRPGFLSRQLTQPKPTDAMTADSDFDDDGTIESNVEFLRTMEEQESSRRKDKRRSTDNKQSKRSSLPSMNLTSTKLLAGKFGDAFKRFEHNANSAPVPRTPSPLLAHDRRDLTPIAGSEATDGRSDDGQVLEETDDMLPEQRREIERRRLSMEERRVAAAAAEYRKRFTDKDAGATAPRAIGGITRAATIQNKVKTLLDENQKLPPSKKTAEGYGRYTDSVPSPQVVQGRAFDNPPSGRPFIARKPLLANTAVTGPSSNRPSEISYNKPRAQPQLQQQQQQQTALPSRTASRPSAPPKPTHLNSLSTGPQGGMSGSPPKHSVSSTSLPNSGGATRRMEVRPDMTPADKEDYLEDFSKRFPSLSGIELVETSIDSDSGDRGVGRGIRTKEV